MFIHRILYFGVSFLLPIGLFNCQPGDRANQSDTAAAVEVKAKTEAGPIPIYGFSDIEHLFHQKTDTTYIINFWATWCKPCVEELPYFEQLTAQYQSEKVKVILISLDFKKQIERKLIPFLKKHNLQSEVRVLYEPDANAWIDKVDPRWTGAIPATVIYKGERREFYEQSFDNFEQINSIVKSFLNS